MLSLCVFYGILKQTLIFEETQRVNIERFMLQHFAHLKKIYYVELHDRVNLSVSVFSQNKI